MYSYVFLVFLLTCKTGVLSMNYSRLTAKLQVKSVFSVKVYEKCEKKAGV